MGRAAVRSEDELPPRLPLTYPILRSGNPALERAYRIAIGDLLGNIQPFQDGLLEQPEPVLLAGLDYDTPWTRDAAINVWNGVGLLWAEVARNTLLSVLERRPDGVYIGGQYWDAIIWALGGWAYYIFTGERGFLALAHTAVCNSLRHFEAEEFDAQFGLFRGPAVYGDGVAAYPDRYLAGGSSSILDWVRVNPARKAAGGYGIPMMALSTNCVYHQAYRIANWMAVELGLAENPHYAARAAALAERIRAHFWDEERGAFRYLVDADGGCDHQEGLGHAFGLLFGLADAQQARRVLDNQVITPAGIPCVWPTFARYAALGGFGRHSGTVWPFISACWGEVALEYRRPDVFVREFEIFTAHINRHAQCAEIIHPLTGEIYGGLQEAGKGADGIQWASCARQSWSASAYLRMILNGLVGMRFSPAGIHFQPNLPAGLAPLQLDELPYRAARLSLRVDGSGGRLVEFRLNGQRSSQPFLPAAAQGKIEILMRVAAR